MRILKIFKEIRNYYYIKGVIRKNKNTPEWIKQELNVGYFGVIYSVINLPPEVFESEEQYYSIYVVEQMLPKSNYLASLNLQEIVTPEVENISNKEQGIFAFGIKYVPLFREFTLRYVLTRLGFISLVLWLQIRFSLFTTGIEYIWRYIKMFFEWAF